MKRLLDLFCGAGGAAVGYARAGFQVVGVDLRPQPHYPFEFHQDDALDVLRWPTSKYVFDAVHASPPCQAYSSITATQGNPADHPDLLGPTRELLNASGLPWVIENVPGAPMRVDYKGAKAARCRAISFAAPAVDDEQWIGELLATLRGRSA